MIRRLQKALYQSADEIEAQVRQREAAAAKLPDGEQRQSALKEIAVLRNYAEAKRWIASPGLKRGA
jgi:hypothetical protein